MESSRELEVASQYFTVYKTRAQIPKNSFVIPRYSSLPYYKELEFDLEFNNSKLVNSFREFQYIANFDYYEDLRDFTFKTWFSFAEIDDNGPFVLKGRTNSRKHRWSDLMYAQDKVAAIQVMMDLMRDETISSQGVIIRKYHELESLGKSTITGQNFANEWRFFYYKTTRLNYGYYWSISPEAQEKASIDQLGLDFAEKCARIVAQKTNFFVLDIARTIDGNWILVEVNEGGCSGIDIENVDEMYRNLKLCL